MTTDKQDTILNEVLLELCRKSPQFITILGSIEEFYRKIDYDSAVGFKMDIVRGGSYPDMDKLMGMGVIVWDRSKNSWKLASEPNDFATSLCYIKEELIREESLAKHRAAADESMVTASYDELIAREGDMLDYWAPQVNPKVEGLLDVKRALLICLASHNDEFGDRGRCHTLMYGDPGSAKTVLIEWIHHHLDADFCSQRTSQVGLTGDGRGEEIVPGALPRAHKRTLCVDELDKFANKDRQGLLESMEEGVVHIDVGKHSVAQDAEVRLLCTANRIDDFSPELMDRFDFRFEMRKPTGEVEKVVVSSIVHQWFRGKPGYDGIDLNSYLTWIKPFIPTISDDVRARTEILMHMLIDIDSGKSGSIRKRESVLRIAYTIAKLNHRNLKIEDVIRAIRILHPTLSETTMKAMCVLMERFDQIRPPGQERGTDRP